MNKTLKKVLMAVAALGAIAVVGMALSETPLPITGIRIEGGNVRLSWDATPMVTRLYEAPAPTGTWYEVFNPVSKGAGGAVVAADMPMKFFKLFAVGAGGEDDYPKVAFSMWEKVDHTLRIDLTNNFAVSRLAHDYDVSAVDGKMNALFLRYILPGRFMMGTPAGEMGYAADQVDVTLTKGYYIGVYEMTQAQYNHIMGSGATTSTHPVNDIAWDTVMAVGGVMDRLQFAVTNNPANAVWGGTFSFTLPTEAQWEYACRAGARGTYNDGDDLAPSTSLDVGWTDRLNALAWWAGNGDGDREVGTRAPNSAALYDMHGNTGEWCRDWYGGYSSVYPTRIAVDPAGPASGSVRVRRDGPHHLGSAPDYRSAARNAVGSCTHDPGFRLCAAVSHACALGQTAPYAFDDDEGYAAQTPLTVTIYNTGLQGGTFSISSSSADFTVSVSSRTIAGGTSATFTVEPVAGLGVGRYSTTITVDGGSDYAPQSFEVSFTVNPTYPFSYISDPMVTWGRVGHTLKIDLETYEVTRLPKDFNVASDPNAKTNALYLRYIRPETYMMGMHASELSPLSSAMPRRAVTLTEGYYVGVYLLTEAQYEKIMGTGAISAKPKVNLSWNELRTGDANTEIAPTDAPLAASFLGVLSTNVFNATGITLAFDLPTEAQWEHAARAGVLGTLPNVNEIIGGASSSYFFTLLALIAHGPWVDVGGKTGNAAGLYDVIGNAWEWCRDIYIANAYSVLPATDPLGTGAVGAYRACRGGDNANVSDSRPAWRTVAYPTAESAILGLRLSAMGAPIEAPEYGFTLSQKAAHAFAEEVAGYGAVPPLSATLGNIGFETGTFAITSSSAAFALSTNELILAAGEGDTFTVAPVLGLAPGDYSATITVDGGANFGSKAFDVSFTVIAQVHTFTLSQTTRHEFTTNIVGYAEKGVQGYTSLWNGVPVTGLSGSAYRQYVIYVPAGATQLQVSRVGGGGNVYMYLKYGAEPTTSVYDVWNNSTTPNATMTVANPAEGYWHFMLRATSTYWDVALTATFTGDYGAAALPVTLENTGNVGGTFALSSSSGNFTLSTNELILAAGALDTFRVAPADGLAAGTYTATITANGGSDFGSKTFDVSCTVVPQARTFTLGQTTPHAFATRDLAGTLSATLQDGVPVHDLGGAYFSSSHYQIVYVPAGTAQLKVTTANGFGNVQIYARYGAPVSTPEYDAISTGSGVNQTLTIPNPAEGLYHIMLFGGTGGYSFVSLTATCEMAPLTVTVTNTGNVGGTFAFSSSSGNFAVSINELTLMAGKSGAFAIIPAADLPAGTHTATITVTGDADFGAKTFDVSVTALPPVYGFELGQTVAHTFAPRDTSTNFNIVSVINFQNGQTIQGFSSTGTRYGGLYVPSSATKLQVSSSGGTGNGDLFVRYNVLPISQSVLNDGASTSPNNNETVIINNPAAGFWYFYLAPGNGGDAYANAMVTMVYEETPLAVTVNNTGNVPGTFAITSSSTAFTVTPSSRTVAGGASDTFTVAPAHVLAPGDYTATITVEGDANYGAKTFDVAVRVKGYSFAMSQTGTYTFPAEDDGYVSATPLTVAFTNTGDYAGTFTLALSGTAFTLSTNEITLAVGEGGTFTVTPIAGLGAGTYTATITAEGDANYAAKSFSVSFTVEFVPVTDITDVPEDTLAGVPLELTGTIVPPNATRKDIVWSVKDAGTTGASVSDGNVLNTTGAGVVTVTATVKGGLGEGDEFSTASIAAGTYHSMALKQDGSLWAWGHGSAGQIGDGALAQRPWPVRVGLDNDWVAITAGEQHSLGLKLDGTLWAWGLNSSGQLGIRSTVNTNAPAQVGTDDDWVAVSAGYTHSLALKKDGTVWAWGVNGNGQLGINSTVNTNAPARVGTGDDWVAVSAGDFHSLAFKRDGTLWAWGYNFYGQLGDGSTTQRLVPVQVGTDDDWTSAIVCGGYHSMAFRANGTLYAWGMNTYGQIGDTTTTTPRPAPVKVWGNDDWASATAGTHHSMAIKEDGSLWAWGNSDHGRLGLGTTTPSRSSPVKVAGNDDWARVAPGQYHTLALKTNGTLWACGLNTYNNLGDGTTTQRESFIHVDNGSAGWGLFVPLDYTQDFIITVDSDNYSFELSQTTTHTFPTNNVGYAALTPLTVTVTNTGHHAGTFALASSSGNFTLSADELVLAAGKGGTFTVVPVTGLPGGDYTATITADGGAKYGAKAFGVAFRVDEYAFEMNRAGTYTFPTNDVGYAALTPLTVTVTNTGNMAGTFALSALKIASQETCATFALSTDELILAAGKGGTFTVAPVVGLPGGDYAATITADGGAKYGAKAFDVAFRVDEYAFEMNRAGTYTFPTNTVGYAALTPLTVTVTNTGNMAGTFTLASSSGNFTLSTDKISLAVGEGGTFTVVPVTGLARGDYTATITANGGAKYGAKAFGVAFRVNVYAFEMHQAGTFTFPTNNVGYAALAPLTVTVTNTGNTAGTFTLASSGGSFTLSTNELVLAGGAGGTFTVTPVLGLGLGDYAATITADGGGNFGAKTFGVAFTVAFIPVTNITGVPTGATAGTPLTLTGTVVPPNAAKKDIVWSIVNAGATGASLSGGNTLNTTGAGVVTVRATVVNGLREGGRLSPSSIAGGQYFTMAIKDDGSLWTWGRNEAGQLGLSIGTTATIYAPARVGSDNDWVAVAAGANHSLALKKDGSLWAWGYNNYGQLGVVTTLTYTNTPVRVGSDNDWASIATGLSYSIALKTDGSLYTWGWNSDGQLGHGTVANVNVPTRVGLDNDWVVAVAGGLHSMALKQNGALYAWGMNSQDQLGIGFTSQRVTTPTRIGSGNDWASVSPGYTHTVALKTDGTLWAWGYNYYGLGDGTSQRNAPVPIGSLNDWTAVAGGNTYSLALKGDGSLWGWGNNGSGQLGDGTTTQRPTPTRIGSGNDWSAIALTLCMSSHSLVLKNDGTLWAWGQNNYGQVGDNSVQNRTSPVQISGTWGLPATPSPDYTQDFIITVQ